MVRTHPTLESRKEKRLQLRAAISVVAILKRALPMRGGVTWDEAGRF